MRKKSKLIFSLIIVVILTVVSIFIDMPNGPYLKIRGKELIKKEIKIREGLDLKGGARLVFSADLSKVEEKNRAEQMRALASAMENRINRFGVTEPTIQTSFIGGEHRLIIELPGVKDANDAINAIGRVADLEFKEINQEGTDFVPTGLTGKDLKSATVDFDQQSKPQISLVFTAEGAEKFAEITERNVNKPLATYLDGEPIQTANVQQKITGGNAVITGIGDINEAKTISKLLNAGRLPVPVKLIEQRTVGATLGHESIQASIVAGVIGTFFVVAYILFSYKGLGIFAAFGLSLDLLFTLALMKLFQITLTMGGVAGLILTIGMSMETDILVFERIREELRKGRSFEVATNLGFKYTWPTIWDSNIVSFIIAVVLMIWSTGTVRGFAVVSILGIATGIVTTFLGSKTLLLLAVRLKPVNKYWFFAVNKNEIPGLESGKESR